MFSKQTRGEMWTEVSCQQRPHSGSGSRGFQTGGHLQVLGSADVQAGDVLDPLVDLIHHWMFERSEPGAERRDTGEMSSGACCFGSNTNMRRENAATIHPLIYLHIRDEE